MENSDQKDEKIPTEQEINEKLIEEMQKQIIKIKEFISESL